MRSVVTSLVSFLDLESYVSILTLESDPVDSKSLHMDGTKEKRLSMKVVYFAAYILRLVKLYWFIKATILYSVTLQRQYDKKFNLYSCDEYMKAE